jgi:hypothetical protein
MRTVGTKLVGLALTSLLFSGPAFATSDVDNELAEMRALVDGLKQKVDAQQEQIEHQSGLLQDAQKVVRDQQQLDQGTKSGMGEFWQAIDVNMSVAGSYAWNFDQPNNHTPGHSGAGLNQGRDGAFYPFHGDHNSFQVDQVWLDIGKKTTNESRAGFMFSILYGNVASYDAQGSFGALGTSGTAACPNASCGIRRLAANDSTSDYYIAQAYVSYLAPLGEGVEFDFGKFETLVGAEVADQSKNWNVTRSNEWTLLQSIDHVGLLGSTKVGPLSFAAGVVNQNNVITSSPDLNSEKSYIGKIGFAPNDKFSVAANVLYGAEGPRSIAGSTLLRGTVNGRRTGLLDLLANYNGDHFSAWVDGDYSWLEDTQSAAWALALAGKVPITQVLSAALRLEYLRNQAGFVPIGIAGKPLQNSEIYGATGTLAYQIAENLTLKAEARWDQVKEERVTPRAFLTTTSRGSNDQVVGIGQVVYAF